MLWLVSLSWFCNAGVERMNAADADVGYGMGSRWAPLASDGVFNALNMLLSDCAKVFQGNSNVVLLNTCCRSCSNSQQIAGMGCFGRLGLLKSHKIAPETGVRHVQQQQQQPAKTATAGRRPAANKERSAGIHFALARS